MILPDELFDENYEPRIHKRELLRFVRRYADPTRRVRYKRKRSGYVRTAFEWKQAILRGAPLLRGFFAEEPRWREKMLAWCDDVLRTI